jgi:hypothetical protein
MYIPLHRRARSLRELIQHHVRLSLADNHTATPTAAREALLLWSAMTAPPSTPADTSIDAEPPNVVVSSAPVTTLTQTPPARIQVANVAYCDAHGWTAMVHVPVVLCDLPLDESTPPVTGAVPTSLAGEPVEVHMDATRAASPVAGSRRNRSPSSPPSPPPRSAPRVNGPATVAARPLANGHASGTLAARRGMPPMRLFSRDTGDTVVEPALQAPPPPPRSLPPVSPTLRRTWINVPHGPSAPPSPNLAHVVVRSRGSPSSGTQGGGCGGGEAGVQASPSEERRAPLLLEQHRRG